MNAGAWVLLAWFATDALLLLGWCGLRHRQERGTFVPLRPHSIVVMSSPQEQGTENVMTITLHDLLVAEALVGVTNPAVREAVTRKREELWITEAQVAAGERDPLEAEWIRGQISDLLDTEVWTVEDAANSWAAQDAAEAAFRARPETYDADVAYTDHLAELQRRDYLNEE